MRRIALWAVDATVDPPKAVGLDSLRSSETEQMLESLLTRSPELLMEGLALIGRQVQTASGPLDLLGIDEDGRAVVFEIKRGTLTREAVAQVLDYASDLKGMEPEEFARLVEENSGRLGIPSIADFPDWYRSQYAGAENPIEESPRMVLVGLGADERARRIVDFLASAGLDIQLLTFHGFVADGKTFLARQVESRDPEPPRRRSSKDELLRVLNENADRLQARSLLDGVVSFIDARFPSYRWPGKWGHTFYLEEQTDEGRPTNRKYVTAFLVDKRPRVVKLSLAPRAVEAGGAALAAFKDVFPDVEELENWYSALEVEITEDNWSVVQDPLARLLQVVHEEWRRRSQLTDEELSSEAEST